MQSNLFFGDEIEPSTGERALVDFDSLAFQSFSGWVDADLRRLIHVWGDLAAPEAAKWLVDRRGGLFFQK